MTTTTATPTTASDKILAYWNVENVNLGYTTRQIMDGTGLSRTTVNDNLRKLAEAGHVIRFDADKVSTWSLTPTRKAALKRAAAKAAKSATKPTPASFAKRLGTVERGLAEAAGLVKPKGTKATAPKASTQKKVNKVTDVNPTPAGDRTDTGRLRKGTVEYAIRDWFKANGNEPTGSYGVAQGIGSSRGATYGALIRMAVSGRATLVSEDPNRYTINFDHESWETDK